jgi:hypothetical protein
MLLDVFNRPVENLVENGAFFAIFARKSPVCSTLHHRFSTVEPVEWPNPASASD